MNSYKRTTPPKTSINQYNGFIGERIEDRVRRMVYNQEPMGDGSPLIYHDRKKGVMPEHNIRTDRFEVAIDSLDKLSTKKLTERTKMTIVPKEDKPEPKATGSENATN